MKRSAFILAYALICLVHLTSVVAGWNQVEFLSKPLIVLTLIGYYFSAVQSRSGVFLLALIFCCLGDSVLLFQSINELFFMLGLGSFLIAHVFYIISYRRHSRSSKEEAVGTQKVRLAFPVILAGSGLVIVLLPSLGALKIPVMVYALVLTVMVVSAIFRMGRTHAVSFWLVFSGAVLFMVSDSLLAINKFMSPLPAASISIMVTYCAAQLLIVEGIIRDR